MTSLNLLALKAVKETRQEIHDARHKRFYAKNRDDIMQADVDILNSECDLDFYMFALEDSQPIVHTTKKKSVSKHNRAAKLIPHWLNLEAEKIKRFPPDRRQEHCKTIAAKMFKLGFDDSEILRYLKPYAFISESELAAILTKK